MDRELQEVKELVANIIADILKYDVSSIDEYDNLVEMGVGSLQMVDINSALNQKFGVQIQVSQFFGGVNTIADISQFVYDNAQQLDNITVPEETADMEAESTSTGNNMMVQSQIPVTYTINQGQDWKSSLIQQFANIVNQMDNMEQTTALPIRQNSTQKSEPKSVQKVEKKVVSSKTKEKGSKGKKPYVPYKKIDLERKQRSEKMKAAIAEITEKYNEKTKTSKIYAEKIRKRHADWRNVAGFRIDMKELIYQLVTKECYGSKIIDLDGNEYIDLAMGFGVNFFGHKPQFILDAVKQEMEHGFPLSMISKNIGDVSELICELTGMERVAYFNSGSEAVMVAVRLARAKTGRKKIVYFAGAYHGTFDGLLGIQGKDYKDTQPMAVGIIPNMINDLIILNYGDENSFKVIEDNADDIAGVLLEAVQSRDPGFQPVQFVHRLREITKKNDIALIFDEMITGFRISAGGAQEFYGVKADIATYGKIVGGGLPIGVVAGISEYMDCLDGGMWHYGDDSFPPHENLRTYAGGTFCHHPLAMAAAKAVLTKIKEEKETLYPEVNRRTKYLANELNEFFEKEFIPMKVTYFGSLFRFEFQGNLEIFYYYMLYEGIYIWEGRNCFLSVAHTDDDIRKIINSVEKITLKMRGVFFKAKEDNWPSELSNKQRMLISKMDLVKNDAAFHECAMFCVGNELDEETFESCVQKVCDRHPSLNQAVESDKIHLKKIADDFQLKKCEDEISISYIQNLMNEPFDIYRERAVRMHIFDFEGSRNILIVAHHLFIDGYSIVQLMVEALQYYNAAMDSGNLGQLKPVLTMKEYDAKIQDIIRTLPEEEISEFWKDCLTDATSVYLPQEKESDEAKGAVISKKINKVQYLDIRTEASKMNCTPFVFLLSAAQILLHRVTNQKQVMIGIPIAGQMQVSNYSLVGYLDNIMPVSVSIMPEFQVENIVKQNMYVFDKMSEYHYMLEEVCKEEVLALIPDINVVFNLDTISPMNLRGQKIELIALPVNTADFDLMVNITLNNNELLVEFQYKDGKFGKTQVESWLVAYMEIISYLIKNQHCYVSDICVMKNDYEKSLSSNVTEIANANDVFLNEVKNSNIKQYTYVALDNYHNLMLEGSYGRVCLLSDIKEIYVTSWIGRVNSEHKLELAGQREDMLDWNGILINKKVIEDIVNENDKVSGCRVYLEDKKILSVELTENEEGFVTLSELKTHCFEKLPVYMCPVSYYLISGQKKIQLKDSVTDETKKIVMKICEDILHMASLGVDENLLNLGLNSIQIISFFAKVQEQFGVQLSFSSNISCLSISNISDEIDRMLVANEGRFEKIMPVEKQPYYEASYEQKRIYIEYQTDKKSVSYNIPAIIYIQGEIDENEIKNAMQKIVHRHEILRTSFAEKDGEIIQIITDQDQVDFSIQKVEEKEFSNELIKKQMSSFIKPFVLEKAPLIRMKLIKGGKDKSALLFDIHHIIFDGFSESVFMQELLAMLKHQELPEVKIQYKDYSVWQKKRLNEPEVKKQEQYWKDIFPYEIPGTNLIYDYPQESIEGEMGVASCLIEKTEYSNILDFCQKQNCTPFIFMLSALGLVLNQHSYHENDVVLGITLEGRNHYQLQDMLGFFVTNLPIRIQMNKEDTAEAFLKSVNNQFYTMFDNAEVPLQRIIELCGIPRSLEHQSVFDVNFTYQDFNNTRCDYVGDAMLTIEEITAPNNMFNLDFEVVKEQEKFRINLHYNKGLFLDETVHYMLQHFLNCIKVLQTSSSQSLATIELTDQKERELLCYQFNDTDVPVDFNKTVLDLFLQQVKKNPKAIALKDSVTQVVMTYEEVNVQSNRIAAKLMEYQVKSNDCIALLCERSMELVVSILGILKSGCAFLPIDINYPKDRIEYILQDAKPKCLIYSIENLKIDYELPRLYIDNLMDDTKKINGMNSLPGPNDLAYIIYTSGTSGKQKGVMIEHKSLMNYIEYACKTYVTENPIIPFFTNYCFDLSITSLFTALVAGGTLVCFQEQQTVLDLLEDDFTMIKLTPVHLKLLLGDERQRTMHKTKSFILGGEALESNLANKVIKKYGSHIEIHNEYGPTEATVGCCDYIYNLNDKGQYVSIGKPIHNAKIYILSGEKLCGIGTLGEICIGGSGVARGYLNKEGLTRDKFKRNPFAEGFIYYTGDMGFWHADGQLEYCGREDEQVKIRGNRIELGEINKILEEIEFIKDSVVVAKTDKDGNKYLCAYFVSDEQHESKEILAVLRNKLPTVMIPTSIMQISKIPITPNGKVNKSALTEVDITNQYESVEARNLVETVLCELFVEVLNLRERVEIDDNFFQLGGHSLHAVKLINLARKKLKHKFTIGEIFQNPTVRQLAELVQTAMGSEEHIVKAEEKDYYPMSYTQKSMFSLQQMGTENAYNLTQIIKFSKDVDVEKMKQAFYMVIERHEILHTQLLVINNEFVQHVMSHYKPEYTYLKDNETDLEHLYANFVKPFNLESGQVIRLEVVEREDCVICMFDMHHIVSDAVSINIFVKEFCDCYNGKELSDVSIQYKDYSEWFLKKQFTEEKKFWSQQLTNIETADMPLDFKRKDEQSYIGEEIKSEVSSELTEKIRNFAKEHGATEYMVFLSTMSVLLSRYTGKQDVIIGSPVSGRMNSDTQNIMGMLTNTLPMRCKPESEKNFLQILQETKQFALAAYTNQEYPFEKLVNDLNVKRIIARNPLFDVMLSFDNTENLKIELDGAKTEYLSTKVLNVKFDLTFQIIDEKNAYEISLEYCSELYKKESAERILENYIKLLEVLVDQPDTKIIAIDFLEEEDKEWISHHKSINDSVSQERKVEKETGKSGEDKDDFLERKAVFTKILEDVLGIQSIGLDDMFFSVGGDSIKAIRIVSKVKNAGYQLTVKDIMKEQTVRAIARKMKKTGGSEDMNNAELIGNVELTPVQKQLFSEEYAKPNHFNQSVMLQFRENINTRVLKISMSEIIKQHDMLRAVYIGEEQKVLSFKESSLFDYYEFDLTETANVSEVIEEECNKIQASFVLETGPLVKIAVFRTSNLDHLMICIHHLVVDGVSWRIILEDLSDAYVKILNHEDVKLPAKTSSYKRWAEAMKEYPKSGMNEEERRYWNRIRENLAKNAHLPFEQSNRTGTERLLVELTKDYTMRMIQEAGTAYGTNINELLLASFVIAVNKTTNMDKIAVQLEGHGRDAIFSNIDISRTVGYFTSIYPVILANKNSTEETIIFVKEMIRAIPNNGLGYSAVYDNDIKLDVQFNYHGNLDVDIHSIVGNQLFDFSDYHVGNDSAIENEQGNPLIIDCQIERGILRLDFNYSKHFREIEIKNFADSYRKTLIEVIDYCCNKKTKTITGSDLGDATISMEDMGTLDDLLGTIF